MLSIGSIIQKSLLHHWRTNVAIALGVAAATAVLTGALIVGDSMRGSLRDLTLERLGKIDELLVSDGFFRQTLANETAQLAEFKENFSQVQPAILFPGGTVETESTETNRATNVSILGITNEFWNLDGGVLEELPQLTSEQVIINQPLADDLNLSSEAVTAGKATVTLRIPKRDQLPADSSLGKKKDLIESLVQLKVAAIVPAEGLGRFGLHPSQADPLNIYVPIELLQDALSRTVLKHKASAEQANVLLIAGQGDQVPTVAASEALRTAIRPTLEDLGLRLKRSTQTYPPIIANNKEPKTIYDYWSLSSDRLVLTDEQVESIRQAFPSAKPVFTYLANDIRRAADSTDASGIPFSMVSAIDFDSTFAPVDAKTGEPLAQPNENEIVLTQWAAEDLGAEPGDSIQLRYFEPESADGKQIERMVSLSVSGIAKLVEPSEPMQVRRGREAKDAKYETQPAVTNDPNLTPEVPGLTDADSIDNWDLPFDTANRIRSQDDQYWTDYRTTPKAYVSLATGQKLWNSRFGKVTSFRIPVAAGDDATGTSQTSGTLTPALSQRERERQLLAQFLADDTSSGLELVAIKRRGLAASSGSTPFDVLFLALSMFVIGSALILVSLLFRLALQQRAAELGLMSAVGISDRQVSRICLLEMLTVAMLGAWLGIQLGVGYAALMIHGLSTWWVGAISRPFLKLHIGWPSLLIGLMAGGLICTLTILLTLRSIRKRSVTQLLAGQLEPTLTSEKQRQSRRWLAPVLFLIAIGLSVVATSLAGEAQAGAFMGGGFFVLSALLVWFFQRLKRTTNRPLLAGLNELVRRTAARNPLRSTLTVGMVAVASFLVVAVSSFRLTPNEAGTAGFDWVARTSQPIIDPISPGNDKSNISAAEVFSFRYKNGEDASCNNLYQSTQPQVLGARQDFIQSFDTRDGQPDPIKFAMGGSVAKTDTERSNVWQLLNSGVHAGTAEDPVPVLIDKNTANYSLKIYLPGTDFQVDYDSGESVHFRAVGFLANTILQGCLITSEENFLSAFPTASGYQYFLIRDPEMDTVASSLEAKFGDYGFDARSATTTLANFMSVQNTYLSTFQTLGGLGLLLGTFGLAAVLIRSVLERKAEFGVMRAIGFQPGQLQRMVLAENAWLLISGLTVGLVAALCSTVPHWLVGSASIPWLELVLLFAAILLVGLLTGALASRVVARMPLLESLRD